MELIRGLGATLADFLARYGLLAIFAVMLFKELGVPVPVPSDLIMITAGVQAGLGDLGLPELTLAIWVAMLVGGSAQFLIARRYSGLRFDPTQVAALEFRYNEVHRRLVGQDDKTEFVEAMVALHSAIFGLVPEQAHPSAEWRVQANNTVDLITLGKSTDVEGDWQKLEELLRRCYRSIREALTQQRVMTHPT